MINKFDKDVAMNILADVARGRTTCDQQTAQIISAEIAELQEKLKDLEEANKCFRSKIEQRNIQIADVKNKLIKAQSRTIYLGELIDDIKQVNDNYLKEICDLKAELIKKLTPKQ